MKTKLFALAAVGALFVVAYAATIDGAIGRGVVVSSANADARAKIDFHVRKYTDGERSRVVGGGSFGLPNRDASRRVGIRFNAARFSSTEHTAEWVGPGKRVIFTNAGPREVNGIVSVAVNDRRRENTGDPDAFSIRFDAEGTAHDFAFRGPVVEGGLSVFHRTE
ncbi:MAG TPA: hypothetical protein PKA27_12625 [Fimbriimonadaceae bacterium]|nr:hypothetical protein [Fimbriimonadaceae bacterium]